MALDFNQYSAVEPFLAGFPAWVGDPIEQRRIAGYQFYEELYDNVPETLKLVQRGSEQNMVYVPCGKVIVNVAHRYTAPGFAVVANPAFGSTTDQALAMQVWSDLAARERFASRFSANKRDGLIRGDWLWHIYADPAKEPGSRVSIIPLDPGGWFPIFNDDNLDELIGVHIVEQFIDATGKERIRRLTYRKQTGKGGPSPIDVTDEVFELDKWGGPGMDAEGTPLVILRPPSTLPSPIDDLPVYGIPNVMHNGSPYGNSELYGLERMIAAIDQSISDEELSLAMDGLGVYATTSGAPDDGSGGDAPWDIGPAKVIEHPAGTDFVRVDGIRSVGPYQEHLKYLHARLDEAGVTPPVAKGSVDVQVAESGVALLLELGPLLAHTAEKELGITDVMTNLLFNLPKWYVAYEGSAFNSLMEASRWTPVYSDKIPPNRKDLFAEYMALFAAKAIPVTVLWNKLRELGYQIPDDQEMMAALLQEQTNAANIAADAVASRINGELGQPPAGA